jgi:branched-subunit amino acid aminotransferase/4-amino-4-deoxychorismate lyase
MSHDVILNGELVPRNEARISIDDRGFLLGDGAFETLRVYHGTPFLLDEHLGRLFASLRLLRISMEWNRQNLLAQVRLLLEHESPWEEDARLRITVTRGGADEPTLLVSVRPYREAHAQREYGVIAEISRYLRVPHPMYRVKSISHAPNLWMRREARELGADEVLQFNTDGWLTEGSRTNVFLVDAAGVLRTPSPAEGCLKGITRNAVLTIATESKWEWREGKIDRQTLESAREIFLTNSLLEIVPVTLLGDNEVGEGKRGSVTRALQDAYRAYVDQRCNRDSRDTPEGR